MIYLIPIVVLFLISLELILLINSKKIGNAISLVDMPDEIRKFHKNPVPLVGGLILCVTIFLNTIIFFFFDLILLDFQIIFFLITLTIFGIFDDKYNLNANLKLIILTTFFTIFFLLNSNLVVSELRFSSFQYIFNVYEYLVFPFTILCSLLLINSINMLDGKNGLCGLTQIIILFFLTYYIFKYQYYTNQELDFLEGELTFIYLYILYLSLFLIFNLRGKVFLGDSGAYLGSFIIIYLILSIYPKNIFLNCEQIFFLLILPGIDMLRVFAVRIKNKKNPFKADTQHLHHLISKKIRDHTKITILIGSSLFILNLLINLFPKYTLIIFIFSISFYILTIKKLDNHEK